VRSLFESVQVGSLTLANRVFMAPLTRKGQSRPSGRELVVSEERNVYQPRERENVLLQLIREKVKFQCGIFIKEVLRQLARKSQRRQDAHAKDSGAATGF
jgi:hypothetical protein